MYFLHRLLASIAILFGAATVVAGGRVLLGADPGYPVYRPLLLFNTLMGLAYVVVGALAWRDVARGMYGAAMVFALNALVLGVVAYLHWTQGLVASQSVRAMTLRTVVWLLLFLGFAWLGRHSSTREERA